MVSSEGRTKEERIKDRGKIRKPNILTAILTFMVKCW